MHREKSKNKSGMTDILTEKPLEVYIITQNASAFQNRRNSLMYITKQNVRKKTKGWFLPLNNLSYIITQHAQRVYVLFNLV